MNIPLLALLLQGIPEQIAVVTLSFVIARIPLNWKKIVGIGLILAFLAYLIRLTPIAFGVHIIILVILLSSMLFKISNGNLSLSLIASLVSFLTLAFFELVSLSLSMLLFHLTPTELYTNELLRIILGEPHVIFLLIFTFLLNRFLSGRGKKHGFSGDKSENRQ